MSSRLVAAELDRADARIEDALAALAELFGADRSEVVQMSPDGRALHTTHSWAAGGEATFPVIAVDTECPWLLEQVRRGGVIRLSRLPGDLPREAEVERRVAARAGLRSHVLVPFTVAGSTPAALGFGTRRSRSWPDSLVERIQRAAEVIGRILTRRRERAELADQLAFEAMIGDLVRSFVSAPADQLDGRIQSGLERVIGYFGADRTDLGRFRNDGALEITHVARRVGVPAEPSRITLPWYAGELALGRTVRIEEASRDLPTDAGPERAYLRQSGLRSLLAIPLEVGADVWGGLSLAAFHQPRRWTDEEVRRLRLVGEILMNGFLHREAAQEARRQQEEMAHGARVAALEELTAALAHDLNQPLAAIQANAHAICRLLAVGSVPGDLDQICDDIAGDATRASDLIHRLRQLLRKREGGMVSLQVNEAVEEVSVLAQAEARRHGARLTLRLTAGLPRVYGNAVQLQQVLLSLVRNAAEAMVETAPEDREVVVRTSGASSGEVAVSVEDHGRALGDRSLADVLTPFHTTKPRGVGTSLAISRAIIETHGGRLWAERRQEGGLVMRFVLPGQEDEAC